MSVVRARVAAQALAGPEDARRVIEQHLRSDVDGRCLARGDLESCRLRDTANALLFGHARPLPCRSPMELIGARGDFAIAALPPGCRPSGRVNQLPLRHNGFAEAPDRIPERQR